MLMIYAIVAVVALIMNGKMKTNDIVINYAEKNLISNSYSKQLHEITVNLSILICDSLLSRQKQKFEVGVYFYVLIIMSFFY